MEISNHYLQTHNFKTKGNKMPKPGKLETHQQLRARINASKEASKIVSKPSKIERVQVPVELVEVPVEVKIDTPAVIVEEVLETVQEELPLENELKPELKPLSKKTKNA
jgi:hypothetical protein